jgi:hypothetical protein
LFIVFAFLVTEPSLGTNKRNSEHPQGALESKTSVMIVKDECVVQSVSLSS